MLTTKLARIKELIEQKERIDNELSQLLGETEKPSRAGSRRKNSDPADVESESATEIRRPKTAGTLKRYSSRSMGRRG